MAQLLQHRLYANRVPGGAQPPDAQRATPGSRIGAAPAAFDSWSSGQGLQQGLQQQQQQQQQQHFQQARQHMSGNNSAAAAALTELLTAGQGIDRSGSLDGATELARSFGRPPPVPRVAATPRQCAPPPPRCNSWQLLLLTCSHAPVV
jgi:hypothetical protein